ncbi:conserved hypothetical protein [Ixodes scapularis]|uniref:Uncharacterized protein n=1 Tax=Ixodes scapularis TaxID=6945 RepID=B7PTC7_IXOSC|nr:conserved hypothetical protein [Ixodes scapularis]|eukprot:XP_002404185.1 conserved hypothetical protein [Ixodes scapularis]
MPFVKWTVEPVFISRQPIPPDKNVTDELEASANITLVGTLRQLACLVSVADCIFEGISAECRLIQERSEALRNKLQRCERTVSELNAKAVRIREWPFRIYACVQSAAPRDTAAGANWHSLL